MTSGDVYYAYSLGTRWIGQHSHRLGAVRAAEADGLVRFDTALMIIKRKETVATRRSHHVVKEEMHRAG